MLLATLDDMNFDDFSSTKKKKKKKKKVFEDGLENTEVLHRTFPFIAGCCGVE